MDDTIGEDHSRSVRNPSESSLVTFRSDDLCPCCEVEFGIGFHV